MNRELRKSYWAEVHRLLVAEHNLTDQQARFTVRSYRIWIRREKVGDMIYHASVEETAKGIMTGEYWKEFPLPGTTEWGKMNQDRAELIQKNLSGTLTEAESVEYEKLQRWSLAAVEEQDILLKNSLEQQRADSVRDEARRILLPHLENTVKNVADGDLHLRALRDDLKHGNRKKAENYLVQMFLKILARQPDTSGDAVMTVTSELCTSQPFRTMICEVVVNIIDEFYPN